eukprot:COSAG01_NODE_76685_length_179_cov_73.475000_1_plen_23_part_10
MSAASSQQADLRSKKWLAGRIWQ